MISNKFSTEIDNLTEVANHLEKTAEYFHKNGLNKMAQDALAMALIIAKEQLKIHVDDMQEIANKIKRE